MVTLIIVISLHWGFREMDADPAPDQGPSGVDDTPPIDTDDQQAIEMLPGIGDSGVPTSVEDVTGQETCQSISDVNQDECVDSGSKANNSIEFNPEDTNVRLKEITLFCKMFL